MNDFDLKGFINENQLGAHSKLQLNFQSRGHKSTRFRTDDQVIV